MKVGFFRHGPAVSRGTAGIAEADRPLTREGRKKTEQAAKGLLALDLGFDAIFTSPLPRARQTAEILAGILHLSQPKVLDLLLPGTPVRRLLGELRDLDAEAPLLVGHEPSLSSAVSLSVCSTVKGAFKLKKAGLALVELPSRNSGLRGILTLLLTPASLRRAGGIRS